MSLSFYQWYVLNQVPHRGASLLIFLEKCMLSCAAWGEASLIGTDWLKNVSHQICWAAKHLGLAFQPVFICPRREISQFQEEKSREKRNGCHAEAVAQHSVGGRTVCRKIRRKFESGFSGSDLDRKSEKLRDFRRCEVSELQLPEIRQQHVPVILLFFRILVRVGSGWFFWQESLHAFENFSQVSILLDDGACNMSVNFYRDWELGVNSWDKTKTKKDLTVQHYRRRVTGRVFICSLKWP